MRVLGLMASVSALCAAAGACATSEDVRALRRPALPPTQVALADRHEELFENVALYEIVGAPEFRLFDGGDLYTTRPTRADVARHMRTWLNDTRLLAQDIAHADYLLTVEFIDVRGPNVIWFTDKNARATVRYQLINRRTRETRFVREVDAQLQARMPGVTEEMVRAAITGGLIGAALGPVYDDATDPVAAGAVGTAAIGADSAAWASWHQTLLWDWPVAMLDMEERISEGLAIGAVLGTTAADSSGLAGAATGFFAAAPSGRPVERWNSAEHIGSFDGTERREQAVRGMLRQSFNGFLFGLDEAQLIEIREAVTCDVLNPYGYRTALRTTTRTQVAYDCPIGRTRVVRPAS